jgi:kynurenine formamidase
MGKLIDLSVGLYNNMPAHAFFPSPILLPHTSHEQARAAGLGEPGDPMTYATNYISMLDHVGTHIDAFYHVNEKGETIDQMPLEMFTGPAVCLDLRHIPDLGLIDVKDMDAAEKKAGVTVAGHIVLLCSGFHKRHFPNRESVTHNPGLTAAATHWLADRGSKLHGVEGPSTDVAGTKPFPSHRVCRDRKMSHVEWLCNLEEVLGKGVFRFTAFPLKFIGGSGSPCRAVAELP